MVHRAGYLSDRTLTRTPSITMSDEERDPTDSDPTEETPPRAPAQSDTSEATARKLKIYKRAGHRGTVTRLSRELEEAVYSRDTRKLKHMKRILEEKSRILATLDEQIAEETEGKKLEPEIQQAGIVKESIDLALMTITDNLETLQNHRAQSPLQTYVPLSRNHDDDNPTSTESGTVTTSHPYTSSTAPEPPASPKRVRISTPRPVSPACDDIRQATTQITTNLLSSTVPPPTSSLAPLSCGNIPATPHLRAATATTFSPSAVLPSMSLFENPLSTPQFRAGATPLYPSTTPQFMSPFTSVRFQNPLATPQFRAGTAPLHSSTLSPPHVSASLSFGDQSTNYRPRVNLSAGYPSTPFGTSTAPRTAPAPFLSPTAPPFIPNWLPGGQLPAGLESSTTSVPQVRLPKLSIRRYNGDLTKWLPFWDSFKSSVHDNPTLSVIDKFVYLTSLLESVAADAIAGLSITSANYEEAISTLKKRFGNQQSIVNKHMDALLSAQAVTSNTDVKSLRKLTDTIEAHVRGLRALIGSDYRVLWRNTNIHSH